MPATMIAGVIPLPEGEGRQARREWLTRAILRRMMLGSYVDHLSDGIGDEYIITDDGADRVFTDSGNVATITDEA